MRRVAKLTTTKTASGRALGLYGEALGRTGSTDTPFRFNGLYGVQTDSNGLYYHRARYYSPTLRRFINQDVTLGRIESAASLNRFAYANGDPVNHMDPFGNMAQDLNPNDIATWWNPFTWSSDDWVAACQAAQSSVGDPLGTAAGLIVYTNVPGTITLGGALGVGGYASVSRNEDGQYSVIGGAGYGLGWTLSATTNTPTIDDISEGGLFGISQFASFKAGGVDLGVSLEIYGALGNSTNDQKQTTGNVAFLLSGSAGAGPFSNTGTVGALIQSNSATGFDARPVGLYNYNLGAGNIPQSTGMGGMIFAGFQIGAININGKSSK